MDEAQARRDRFDGLPIRQAVLRQIVPAIFSQMVVLIYNLADTYFVGLLNAPDQTAAVAVSMPAFLMLTAISNLFAIGGASQVARQLGKRAPEAASADRLLVWPGQRRAGLRLLLVRRVANFAIVRRDGGNLRPGAGLCQVGYRGGRRGDGPEYSARQSGPGGGAVFDRGVRRLLGRLCLCGAGSAADPAPL